MAPETQAAPAIGYGRVSRVLGRGGESFISPDVQRAECERICAARGLRMVAFYLDLDQSGGKRRRPELDRALADIAAGRAVALVAATQNRVSRSVRDLLAIADELTEHGARLEVGDLPEAASVNGQMMRAFLATIAEGELARYREQWDTAKASAVARGVYIARQAPIGYSFDSSHRLEPNEDADAVRTLFEIRTRGASWRECANHLETATGRRYDFRSIPGMIRNRAYLGHSVYADLVNEEAHPAIVSHDVFTAAQDNNGGDGRKLKRSGVKSLLAGLAVCEACGRKMASTSAGGVSKGTRVYRCPGNTGTGAPCTARASILQDTLDEFVTNEILRWASAEGLEDRVIEGRPLEDALAVARERTAALIAERDAYAVSTAGLGIPAGTIALGLQARENAVQDALAAENALRESDTAAVVRTTLRELFPTLTVLERRRLFAAVVERVSVRRRRFQGEPVGDRARILWK